MIENQSTSEKERMDHQPNPDLLSDLPLSIIHMILARVPIRDAVRTSVLSRQWRYTWAGLSHLVFEEFRANQNEEPIHKFEERLKITITHVLFRHQGPIHKCKLSIFSEFFFPKVDEWILHLSRNGIKELILEMGGPDCHCSQHLHSSIYSCEKLTNLEHYNCDLDPPPSSFKGFMFLRRISLHEVYLSSNGIKSLVANSPFLEAFTLCDNGYSDVTMLRISAPNLTYLDISGEYFEICLNAPLLAQVSVSNLYCFTDRQLQQKSSICNYTNFFGGLTNLEKLCGDINFRSIGMEPRHSTLIFHHLKDIEINDVNFEDINQISVVILLVVGSPNLHKLKISNDLGHRDVAPDSEPPYVRFSDFGRALDFTFMKLRVVIMENVGGFPSEVEFMVFFIQTLPVLETMTVYHLDKLGTEEKQISMDELLECEWASPNAQLLIPIIP